MAGVKGNRRILYTQKVIKESLLELLQDTEIHKITVTDICKKANINRGTFYLHYKDAFHLLQCMEDDLFNAIIEYINETPVERYRDVLLLKVLELIRENKDLAKILICQKNDSRILDRILYIARTANIDQIAHGSPDCNSLDEVHLDYLIKYAVGGTLAIIQNWLEGGLIQSPSEILDIINNINKFTQKYFY